MDRILSESTSESSPADSRLWISRFLIAVVLGEAIWGFLVSITNNLVLPAMARVMSGDAQSPLSLGKGDFNVPGLFASILEFCFAAIGALVLNSWSQKSRRIRVVRTSAVSPDVQPVRVAAAPAPPSPVVTPSAPLTVPASTPIASQTTATPVPKTPEPPPTPAPPAKPQKQKAVYYNIVGEPVDPDE